MLSNNVSVVFIIQLVQQKDGIQTELTQMSLAKTKLESLCRELQKHSKAVVVSVCVFDVRMCLFMCVFVHVCMCMVSGVETLPTQIVARLHQFHEHLGAPQL